MHVALVMDLAGCLFLGRALSVRQDRGVTSCAWGEACAHEHTWALKKMCSAAYARVVCMKIVDIKNCGVEAGRGCVVVRALSASRIAVPRGVRGRARAREHTWALRASH